MNQAAPDRHPKPTPETSGQEILHARNSHARLLTLLHDVPLAQYRTSVPAQTRTPHRLTMWSCASLLLDILSAPSRQGKHRGSFNRRTFSSLPLHGTDEMQTAEQHNSLALILPELPRHGTELAEKHKLWAAILSDWIQGGSVIATVVETDNPTLRLDLALLGLTLLRWFEDGSEKESASLNELRIGHDKSYCNWAEFSTILGESVQVREAIIALLTSAPDPRRQEVQVVILKASCTTINFLYKCVATGYPWQDQHNRTRHDSLVASNLLPVLLRAMEPSITGVIPA